MTNDLIKEASDLFILLEEAKEKALALAAKEKAFVASLPAGWEGDEDANEVLDSMEQAQEVAEAIERICF